MQLHKIKQYNAFELIHILFFKIVYKTLLLLRKVYVALIHPKYEELHCKNGDEKYQRLSSSLYSYYGFVCKSTHIQEKADSILKGKTTVFGHVYSFNPDTDWLKDPETGKLWPGDLYWDKAKFIEKGYSDVKLVLEINKLNDIVTLAQAYYITKEDRYLQGVERYLNGWVKCVPVEFSVANKIVMDFGFRVINLIHVSLLCGGSDYFRERIHPLVLGIMKHHVGHLWRYLSSRWFKSGNDNNHNIGEIVGLYSGQLWMSKFGYGGGILYRRKIRRELKHLEDVTKKLISPSGCYLEQSASYTRLVHDFFLMFEIMRHSLDYNRSFGWFDTSGYFEKLSNYLLAITYHGGLPNFGDNDYARVVIPFEEAEDLVAHVRKHSQETKSAYNYEADGQWLYKSGDENDVYLFTRVGNYSCFVEGAFIHAHNDLLSLLIGVKGKPLFIDKGTLYYNSGSDIRQEFSSTGAHNTIQIEYNEMADLLPIGYRNYPKSMLLLSERYENRCEFKGVVMYKDITHNREVSYDGKNIAIVDTVSKKNTDKERGVVRYLLGEGIAYQEEDNKTILLTGANSSALLRVQFEGVESIAVKESSFAPHYGLKKRTSLVEAYFEIDNQKIIKTVIQVL